MKRLRLALSAPYVGLRPFAESDALLFFGRDAHVNDLLAKLERRQRFVAVLGASGTGKSSLVLAGLVPALRRGGLKLQGAAAGSSAGLLRWNVCVVQPGNAPLARLAHELTEDPRWVDHHERASAQAELAALLAATPRALVDLWRGKAAQFADEALLLVVDQFEELFRYRQRNPDEAERFVQLLLRSATEDMPIHVVMTMRSDFLGHAVAFHGLPEAINGGLYLTPRLAPEPLRSVIVSPLALVSGSIDPVLANRLANSLGGEDELPMLQHALLRMWDRARADGRSTIVEDDFAATCTPREAKAAPALAYGIDRHADEIFEALAPPQQAAARELFTALVERREGRDVRRPQTLEQVAALVGRRPRTTTKALAAVVEAFSAPGAGFLRPATSPGPLAATDLIDIGHESLIRGWQRLQAWLSEEDRLLADFREFRQRAQRRAEGGSWLDAADGQRAQRWLDDLGARVDPARWAERHAPAGVYAMVARYVQASVRHASKAAAQAETLRRENEEARVRAAEAEARLQRALARQARLEKARAEAQRAAAARDLEQAQALALVEAENAKAQTQARRREQRLRKMAQEQAALAEDRLNRMKRIIEQMPDARLRRQLMLENIPGTARTLTQAQQKRLQSQTRAHSKPSATAAPRRDVPSGLKLWDNGSVLRIRLIDANKAQRALVERAVQVWSAHVNLSFEFVDKGPAEIRVAFDPNDGGWSYVGTDALAIPQNEPTMNLAWIDDAGTLGQFGYVLGLLPEHQNPNAKLPWNREAVYQELTSAPNLWDRATVDYTILKAYDVQGYRDFDPRSVMMKDLPGHFFTDGVARGGGNRLSVSDKAFVTRLYPRKMAAS